MRSAFFFVFLIVAIWTGIEVTNHGMGGAFGGLFVRMGLATPEEGADATLVGRAAGRVDDAYRRVEERAERSLE